MDRVIEFMDKQVAFNKELVDSFNLLFDQAIKLTEEVTRLKLILEENGIEH